MALSGILSLWNKSEEFKNIIETIKEEEVIQLQISGLKNSARSFLISALIEEINHSGIIITDNQENALQIFQDLTTFLDKFPGKNIFLFPSFDDILPYEDEDLAPDPQILEQRMEVLKQLSSKIKNQERAEDKIILITEVKALLSKLASPLTFQRVSLKLKVGDILRREDFLRLLLEQNYKLVELVENKGEFSTRGGIIDFFPFASKNPLRLELFGDQIESIRYFNINTQGSMSKIDDYILLPSCEFIPPDPPNYSSSYSTLFDYLPPDCLVLLDEPELIKERVTKFEEEIKEIYPKKGEEEGESFLPSPSSYWVDGQEVYSRLKSRKLVEFTTFPSGEISENREEGLRKFVLEGGEISSYWGNLELLAEDLKKEEEERQNVIILLRSEGRANRLGEILEERGIKKFIRGKLEEYPGPGSPLYISSGYLNYGFKLPEIDTVVITEQEIFGKERKRRYKSKSTPYKSEPLYSTLDIVPGDYVVHIDHGIGIYRGIVNLAVRGARQDYLFIEYAEGDKLYVPVDQLNLVHKYVGMDSKAPKIYRLGGVTWERTKRKVKSSIKKLAQELYHLYNTRKEIKGHAFSSDSNWQQELEMSFPFEETYDQLQALTEVKKDMESPRPMERLICGDVGYGKTEVAIRAAFKAVLDGKQVAILAPTTILAQQHYETFQGRMNSFPVNIEMLSRFRDKKEQKEIVQNLKEGKIDIIIGTHRLVQEDIQFRDLGLLVIDEEQRFGVLHKERIKKLKESVDSLTLTATPIPRTLHMSLIGVRDLSVINTPPEDRFPVVTYIGEREDRIIVEAIKRELQRGGQVFFVHNRVKDIQKVARDLNRLLPQARIGVAHGQMAEEQLEELMIDFLEKKYDILVCTTIIEIGLDIPNVNTIIVDEAYKFGLSQLYQLRGRVGRADRQAYAYFLYPTYRSISDTAKKRLQAIQEFSELGSGFKLAMRDLEIRGAGNLLGKEQHGFVSEVGFNLYCHLLEEEIKELKEEGEKREDKEDFDPLIEIPLETYIPETYIPLLEQRVLFYRKLSETKDLEGVERIKEELKDRYGLYPPEVRNLLEIIYLKIFLKRLRITSLEVKGKIAVFRYSADITHINNKLNKLPSTYQNRLIKEDKRLRGIFQIDLSGIRASEILKFLKELLINLAKDNTKS